MNTIFDAYTKILTEELKPALGCTEPVAIAFASASAAKALGTSFTSITVKCSGNVVKNVKSVTVPNSGGMKGIEAAALLGALGGNASLHLEVLSTVTDEIRNKVKEIVNSGICKVILAEDIPGLYISVTAENGSDSATAVLKECHDELYSLSKNGKLIINNGTKENSDDNLDELRKLLNLKDILSYAKNVEIDESRKPLKRQV